MKFSRQLSRSDSLSNENCSRDLAQQCGTRNCDVEQCGTNNRCCQIADLMLCQCHITNIMQCGTHNLNLMQFGTHYHSQPQCGTRMNLYWVFVRTVQAWEISTKFLLKRCGTLFLCISQKKLFIGTETMAGGVSSLNDRNHKIYLVQKKALSSLTSNK